MLLNAWFDWTGLPNKWIAAEAGVDLSLITHWREGTRTPIVQNLFSISRVTGIPLDHFRCAAAARQSIATHEGWIHPLRRS